MLLRSRGETETPIAQIAKDFGISDAVTFGGGLPRLMLKMV